MNPIAEFIYNPSSQEVSLKGANYPYLHSYEEAGVHIVSINIHEAEELSNSLVFYPTVDDETFHRIQISKLIQPYEKFELLLDYETEETEGSVNYQFVTVSLEYVDSREEEGACTVYSSKLTFTLLKRTYSIMLQILVF